MRRSLVVLCVVTTAFTVGVLIYSGLANTAYTKLWPSPGTGEIRWTNRHEQQQQQQQREQTPLQGNQQKEQLEERPGIVELKFLGRLGNNLFEYAVARVFADKLGWALLLKAGFNKDKFKTLLKPHGMSCFPGVRPVLPSSWSPEMAKLQERPFRGFKQELVDPTPRKITLSNWFQDYKLFAGEKDRLRQIMAMDPSCCGPTAPGPDDMVIHYRNYRAELSEGQYKNLFFKDLDFAFYDKVLRDVAASSQGRPENVWVVGEFDENNPLVTRLKEEHDVKIAKMVADQFHAFCFLSRAPRLVMAPSTFSWWAAFLGNATEVHFPFQPSRRSVTGPQVVVYDEPRYIYRNLNGLVVRPSF